MKQVKKILRKWIPLAVVITAMCGLVYLTAQQLLRMGANEPQIQMAEDAAGLLAKGATVESVLPANEVELSESIAPFLIVFNEAGVPVASSAVLHGQEVTIPAGIFDYVRENGEDRVTWQPEAGVRIASVVVGINGGAKGFVLAGCSLREAEARVDQMGQIAGLAWIVTLAASLVTVIGCEFLLSSRKDAR
jgi:hypothetical protein